MTRGPNGRGAEEERSAGRPSLEHIGAIGDDRQTPPVRHIAPLSPLRSAVASAQAGGTVR